MPEMRSAAIEPRIPSITDSGLKEFTEYPCAFDGISVRDD